VRPLKEKYFVRRGGILKEGGVKNPKNLGVLGEPEGRKR